MDAFKKACAEIATAFDHNCPRVCHSRSRGRIGKMIRRIGRRKIKREAEMDYEN